MASAPDNLQRDIVVDDERLVSFMGPELRVYGTPRMLADAEMACRDLLLQRLEEGFDSVGVGVQLEHLGGAVEGDTVSVSVRLKSFDGRKADFEVEVTRKGNVIGRIGHQRAAVPLDKLKQRIVAMQQGKA